MDLKSELLTCPQYCNEGVKVPHVSELSAQVRAALDAAVAAIGGQPREGQIEMAEAVANALTDRHHLMVQAGTGTGASASSASDGSTAPLMPCLRACRRVCGWT